MVRMQYDYNQILLNLLSQIEPETEDVKQSSIFQSDYGYLNLPNILEQYSFQDFFIDEQQLELSDILLQIDALSPNIRVEKLRQWQKQILQENLLSKDNLLVSAGTASGKTHVSVIFALYTLIVQKKCVIFSAPYVTIVNELVDKFSQFLTGNYGLSGLCGLRNLPEFLATKPTIYICTNEKAYQILKKFNEQGLQENLGLVIVDELQVVGEVNSDRSVLLETFINYFLLYQQEHNVKLITMSATLSNHLDIEQWLNCKTFLTDYSEQKLQKFIINDNQIYDFDTLQKISDFYFKYSFNATIQLKICVMAPKPLIMFVPTRNQCLYFANQLGAFLVKNFQDKVLNNEEKTEARKILNQSLDQQQQSILAGVAYHNASLSGQDRMKIENSYSDGILHTIIATSTLAAGVNLPAMSVFINQLKVGMSQLDSVRFKQMTGRAGRFEGKQNAAIFIVSDNVFSEILEVKKEFVCKSLLLTEQYKNNSINSILINAFQFKKEFNFGLQRTLYHIQNDTKNADCLENINFLLKIKFLALQEGNLSLTQLGQAANEASLSPYQAYYFDQLFEQIKKYGINPFDSVSIFLFSYSPPASLLHLLTQQSFSSFLSQEVEFQYQINMDDIISQDKILLEVLQIQSNNKKTIKNIILQQIINISRAFSNSNDVQLKSPATILFQVKMFAQQRKLIIYSLFEKYLNQIKEKISDDITELLEIPQVGNNRAQILKQAGFNNYVDIVHLGIDTVKLRCNFGQTSDAIAQTIYNQCEKMNQK
ncbi:DNA helicase [Spironucleus salmonicida]|uniref:DNA helicase n=1 Tax=Spironucleus salmonicida TaxID=348837 RepID=V6LNG4_9EUKA|nr:DNA helicase [Spironucleus salmonicida]|eukprot:EST45778.1 DNA helicase [Spironucleus salmonicida]